MQENMPLIADTYKIIGEIGSGGGGIVYMGEHTRLGKKVVLKADKRNLSAKPEVLRREVDALKNLSHTYIPQVYDFIEEGGVVYTVMDYIDGDSFDKPLKRGERFSQAQVVEWACQLLDALVYLHSRPPYGILHADIKPANVMLTPQGDIRLIDFNIALALGEEGAIAVGRSFGYASPEHYGQDYSSGNVTQGVNTGIVTDIAPNEMSDIETVLESKEQLSSSGSSSGKKKIMLNVRSDIYSLGATLYHIMTGERPAQNATEVKPMSRSNFSSAVIDIIAKAMNPNPNLRYQTAEEMLHAFKHLRDNDPRTRRYKRTRTVMSVLLALLFAGGMFTSFTGLKRMEMTKSALALAADSQIALADGNLALATSYALQALPQGKNIFTPPHLPQAQRALADALGVYDLSDGYKPHSMVELPSEPFKTAISPDGRTGAAVYAFEVAVFDTQTGEISATLPAVHSALADIEFADENLLVYAGQDGLSVYDIVAGRILWTGKQATEITVSADGRTISSVYRDESFASLYGIDGSEKGVVDFAGKKQSVIENDTFANPDDKLFALDKTGAWLAVSFSDGALTAYDLADVNNSVELFEAGSGYNHFEGGFSAQFLAFSATQSEGESVFAVINMEQMVQEGGFDSTKRFGVIANEDGIFLSNNAVIVKISPVSGEQTEVAYTSADVRSFSQSVNGTAVATQANDYVFFDVKANMLNTYNSGYTNCDFVNIAGDYALVAGRDTPKIRVLKRELYDRADIFYYPEFDHDEARISADGTRVMMFNYKEFRVYDINGNLICEKTIPDAASVYDQQHSKKSGNLAVIYQNALRIYSGKDGELIFEKTGLKSTFYAPYGISIFEQNGTMSLIDIDTAQPITTEQAQGDFAAYCGLIADASFLNGGQLIGAAQTDNGYILAVKNGEVCSIFDSEGNKKFQVFANEQSEAFFTSNAVIVSPLHGTPIAYSLSTGEKITDLEIDSYLTYVKELDGYIISEYVTADSKQYAILLDSVSYQPLAALPQFADITSANELLFDYKAGTMRKSRIYSIDELINLAKGGGFQ